MKLFNAVQQQQKVEDGGGGGTGHGDSFLDMLRMKVGSQSSAAAAASAAAAPASSAPSFLRDDYARSKLKGNLNLIFDV